MQVWILSSFQGLLCDSSKCTAFTQYLCHIGTFTYKLRVHLLLHDSEGDSLNLEHTGKSKAAGKS